MAPDGCAGRGAFTAREQQVLDHLLAGRTRSRVAPAPFTLASPRRPGRPRSSGYPASRFSAAHSRSALALATQGNPWGW